MGFALSFAVPAEAAQKEKFDHFSTGFPLTGGHARVTCESCHKGGVFEGAPTRCAGCHDNIRATGKNSNHITTQRECDTCHTTNVWAISRFDHSGVTETCLTCHDGVKAVGKSANHPQSSNRCEDCHNTNNFSDATFDHSGVSGNCFSCHNGVKASGKSPSHFTSSNQCEDCHKSTKTWSDATY
ncbi:MAG: cytochrome c3 family protein, partial [Sphingorhabdus sp.]